MLDILHRDLAKIDLVSIADLLGPVATLDFRGNKFKVHVQQRVDQDASWFSFYDEAVVRDRDWTVQKGDYIIDVGSAYGSYALTAMASGACRLLCFNPNEGENEALRSNLSLNGWSADIRSDGLYSKSGWIDDVSQIFTPYHVDGSFKVVSLDSLALSEFDEAPRIFLKLDVEGAEVEVLKGAEAFLKRNIDKLHILVENHEFKAPGISLQVREYLTLLDFTHVRTEPHHGVSHSLYVGRNSYCNTLDWSQYEDH